MTRLRFSRPATMRSTAAVKSSSVTASPSRRVADARRVHPDELGPLDGEERNVGFARHRPGQQRLARPRRAHEEDAPGDARAEPAAGGGLARKRHDLHG